MNLPSPAPPLQYSQTTLALPLSLALSLAFTCACSPLEPVPSFPPTLPYSTSFQVLWWTADPSPCLYLPFHTFQKDDDSNS